MDPIRRFWIAGLESLVEGINPVLRRFRFKSLPECGIRSRSLKQSINNRSEVESRTANQQDPLASVSDVGNCCICEGLIVSDRKGLENVNAVYEVMPCCLLFFGGRFRGADVHLSIDLAGIDRDNLGIETLRELNRYLCFTDCCGTEKADEV